MPQRIDRVACNQQRCTDMGLPENLFFADFALRHVLQTMTNRRGNRITLADQARIPPAGFCVLFARWKTSGSVQNPTNMQMIRGNADRAIRFGCGNCDEHASLAFTFLERVGIRPIDYMVLPNHAFVVIGRPASSDPTDYTTWGNEAVICDPWDHKVFPAADIPTLMFRGKVRNFNRKWGADYEGFRIMLAARIE